MGKSLIVNIRQDTPEIMKFGCLALDITEEEMLEHFSFGEMLHVTLLLENGKGTSTETRDWSMPFCQYFDEVEPGELMLCSYNASNTVIIARNYGSFGHEIGLMMSDSTGCSFKFRSAAISTMQVMLSSEGRMPGYIPFFKAGRRKIGKEAGFRMVHCKPGQGGVLYRSAHPFDDIAWQSSNIDKLAKQAGVRSVINLANTYEEAAKLAHFHESYCASCETAYINLPLNNNSPQFGCALRICMDFLAEHTPPFLIFCLEGRDRTGLLIAILQSLLGIGVKKIVQEYLLQFVPVCNQEHLKVLLAKERQVLLRNLEVLHGDAQGYFRSIGVPQQTLERVMEKLGKLKEETQK